MMALMQENVHYTLNSGPVVMNKSNRVHVRIQEFLPGEGGGGGGGRGPTARKQSGQCFLAINLFYSSQSGSNGFITEGRRGSKEAHITCDYPGSGGPDPLTLWIRTWGRLTPLFAYRIMVYQNLNKTEKYHPTTTKRKKAISCCSYSKKVHFRKKAISCCSYSKETHITCDYPGSGGPDPLTLWIRTWGRLTPLFAYRIMVYQNLNKTEKYHPTTTKRKKAISCWSR